MIKKTYYLSKKKKPPMRTKPHQGLLRSDDSSITSLYKKSNDNKYPREAPVFFVIILI